MRSKLGATAKILLGLLFFLTVLVVGVLVYFGIVGCIAGMPKVQEVTTPLERETVYDLCGQLNMVDYEHLCRTGSIVYATDFFPVVKQSFKPGMDTYSSVQEKLGRYLYECRDPITGQDGKTTFECLYDLRGDERYMAQFEFTDDGVLDAIFASGGAIHPY